MVGGRAWLYGSSSGGAIALAAAAELPGVERLLLWEALAWTQTAPRRRLWSSVTAPTVVLLGSDPFPFFVDAAESIVGALPSAETAVVPGGGHRWRAADLAACIAGHLPGRVNGVPAAHRSS